MSITEKDKENIWHPYTQMKNAKPPIVITRGDGAYLFDEGGNKYIDAISSWWVNTHGHSHPHIAEKVSEQLNTLEHTIFAGFTHPKAVELAERLLKALPANHSKIFYSDNGSTAVEVAVKMTLQYWHNQGIPKTRIIAFNNAFHGDTFGAMSVSGRGAFTEPFKSLLFDVSFIDAPTKGHEETSLNQLKSHISHLTPACRTGRSHISSFIFEPLVQGAAGMVMYEPKALDELIKCCKENGVLTIADEVMTGFGRTGKFFASDFLNEKPDIICMSKGLTGGTMALGATSCTQDIYNTFLSDDKNKTFFHGHSFTANPLACSAACASLDLFDKPETWEGIKRIEQKHTAFFDKIKGNSALKEIRQRGTILAIELETDGDTSYFNPLRDKLYDFFIERKIIIRPLGNVIYVLPPYCISDDDLDIIYEVIDDCLDDLCG